MLVDLKRVATHSTTTLTQMNLAKQTVDNELCQEQTSALTHWAELMREDIDRLYEILKSSIIITVGLILCLNRLGLFHIRKTLISPERGDSHGSTTFLGSLKDQILKLDDKNMETKLPAYHGEIEEQFHF